MDDKSRRLFSFLESLHGDLYPETQSELHSNISRQVIERCVADGTLRRGDRLLDMGCGQGVALALFRRHGIDAIGITMGEDYRVCRDAGYDVREMDFSFLDFEDATFDFVWCRHALEHSVFPLFTLHEIRRVLRPGGRAYVEVPAPDTIVRHENNPNHYSVLGMTMWLSLFDKAGFTLVGKQDIVFRLKVGPDAYHSFLLRNGNDQ
jgi:SAM-dependent methyltransferase